LNDLDPFDLLKQLGNDDDLSIEIIKKENTLDKEEDESLSYDESDEDLLVLSDDEDLRKMMLIVSLL
jgi:hypothetical protein